MKTTHTRGRWQLGNATSAGRFVGSSPDGVLGIAMAFGDSPDEQDANARLIAAAPDLLEACKAIAVGPSEDLNHDEATQMVRANLAKVRAAIAKAEGRS